MKTLNFIKNSVENGLGWNSTVLEGRDSVAARNLNAVGWWVLGDGWWVKGEWWIVNCEFWILNFEFWIWEQINN